MERARIVSLRVGLPRIHPAHDENEKAWESGIAKTPVEGAVWLGRLNLAGDKQADLKNHGGQHKAVLMYAAKHYTYWRKILPDRPWEHGSFGENLTVTGLTEANVAIGDIYVIGAAHIQVSQPRNPCWKLARRCSQPDMIARVNDNGFSGWYVRVLEEGEIAAGMDITLLERPYPQWTIEQVQRVMQDVDQDLTLALELASCPSYSSSEWRDHFTHRLRRRMGVQS
jgi:MOSC domain-containing protein YiiM